MPPLFFFYSLKKLEVVSENEMEVTGWGIWGDILMGVRLIWKLSPSALAPFLFSCFLDYICKGHSSRMKIHTNPCRTKRKCSPLPYQPSSAYN